ncbi:AraC family transcriptional regulator [Amycolatopsis sp. PS_44_ISF1]|uniref:AraC family transcriptional regulator n=1 Tax=Amycolatopsis sp. PS_44_ISF1 TaxID=2974917 RepID=UPI0028DD4F66|nr:AraC family transcriptional regulator [Amycolatopsis sp. PS_44_ISF1]MDT8913326.1 AraC family transcriptional regulator [Amycolatopsis sp. PS_44_ISF1]
MDLLDELRDLITRHTGRGTLRKRRVTQDASVTFAGERTEPMAVMSEPSLAVVAQGVKRTVLNGTAYDYRAGQYVVVPVDLPVIGQAPAARPEDPLVVFSLTLSPALIAALLLEAPAAAPAPAFGGLVVGDAPTELLDPVVRLLRVAAHPDDLRVLGPGLVREIHWRLLTGAQSGLVRRIGLADGGLAHVARAIRWLREHYAAPVRVADLAGRAGMSTSTFHRHFRATTSMTPIQFQKQIRLQEARARLAARPRSMAEVGHLVGYDSQSQFTREYRRAFGVTPGRDAAQLRDGA